MNAQPLPSPVAAADAARRRVSVVINRRAGSLLQREPDAFAEEICAALDMARCTADVALAAPAEMPDAVRRAIAGRPDILVIGGGDGSVASAARVLGDAELTIAVLPLGTMNFLARDLGMPLDPLEAVRAIGAGEARRIDMGEINGTPFLNRVVLGGLTGAAAQREKRRAGGLRTLVGFTIAAYRAIARYPQPRLRVRMPERPELTTRTLVVSNNPVDGDILEGRSRRGLEEGRLGVYATSRRSPWKLLADIGKLLAGRPARKTGVDAMLATELRVDSRRPSLHAVVDGELDLLATPLVIRIRPRALSVVVPRRDDPA